MSATGLEVFDTTIQKTNIWLNDLERQAGFPNRHAAYKALRATLHALRDRLIIDEVAQLAAQLPMLIRGLYYEGWDPSSKPLRIRHRDEFLERIAQELKGADRTDPELAARGVFAVLALRVSEGEIEDIRHLLPAKLQDLWPHGPSANVPVTGQTRTKVHQ
jgi:uncharacterized protein (DUF2267 family)